MSTRGLRRWSLPLAVLLLSPVILTATPTSAHATPGTCYGASYTHTSPAGTTLPVGSFGAYFNPCNTTGQWAFDLIASAGSWTTNLNDLQIVIDGGRVVINVSSSLQVTGASCSSPAEASGAKLTVGPCTFSNSGTFTWREVLTPTSGPVDELPAGGGSITESGYIPAGVVCAAGAQESGRQVLTTSHPQQAKAALLRGGATDVRDHGEGVVTFRSDAHRATRALQSAGVDGAVSAEHVRRLADVPNDPGYAAQWSLPMVNATAAWSVTHGNRSTVVADIDTGVDFSHPDLAANLTIGYDAVNGIPIGVGDVTDNPFPPARDHGTEVASVISAVTNNGAGMAGTGWSTSVMPVKVDDASQGGIIDSGPVSAGIRWAADHGARVVNLSLGGACSDPAELAAIQYAQGKGLVVVASVGNDALPCPPNNNVGCGNPTEFPAGYPGVIGVAANGRDGARAFYSNAGSDTMITAPGGSAIQLHPEDDILVAIPGGGYATAAGTSFSSPMVAATAALIFAADPSLSAQQVHDRILTSVQAPPGLDSSQPFGTNEYGFGELNMGAALAGLPPLPPPAGLSRYWMVATDGGIFSFGTAGFFGSTGNIALNRPIVDMSTTPGGHGYWLAATDGGIFAFGDARFFGSTGAIHLNQPVVGMTSTPTSGGYWLVATDGGIFTFGDALFLGSTGAMVLNRPIVGMAATPTGRGYWLVASDGGIFSFGDARFFGSTGNIALNRPIVGMTPTPDGGGYWLVASDGGIFAFGDARFFGSTGNIHLNRPIVGMAATPTGHGYWLAASDGGVFAFGDARFLGSMGRVVLNRPVVGVV